MEATPFVEKIFKKTPGLDLVVVTITGLMVPFIINKDIMEDWGLVFVPAVWLIAVGLSRVSAFWDHCVFDPFYGTSEKKTTWYARGCRVGSRILFPVTVLIDHRPKTRLLNEKRRDAVLTLKGRPTGSRLEPGADGGIYKSAVKIFEGTEEWEDDVKARLEYSKAARVFIFPLLIQIGWGALHWATFGWTHYLVIIRPEHEPMKTLVPILLNPIIGYLVVLQITVFLYLYLRIAHMSNLFDLVIKSRVFRFVVNCERDGQFEPREMLNVGSKVVPRCELEIFKGDPRCRQP